jgi:hypothetical protein
MRLKSLLVLGLVVAATTLVAQRRQRAPDALPNTPYDGKFTFVRIRSPGGMGGRVVRRPALEPRLSAPKVISGRSRAS